MSVSMILNQKIELTSNNAYYKKEQKDGKYYIVCYINNNVPRFKLEYDNETDRDSEFNQLIDDVYNGIVNIDVDYTGNVINNY